MHTSLRSSEGISLVKRFVVRLLYVPRGSKRRKSDVAFTEYHSSPLRPINRIPHYKPPLDVLFEYRKQFQVPLKLEGISCASIVAIERLRLRGRVTENQSELQLSATQVEHPVYQLCARLRIHSASRLYIFPRLRTAELARLSASLLIATEDNDPRSRAHGPFLAD